MSKKIRPIVLGLILHENRLFLSEGRDEIKQQNFYRALGGGIDFGETSDTALRREFQEELSAELTNIRYIACIENLFTYEGKPGHELVQLYRCDFADDRFYKTDRFTYIEGKHQGIAGWYDIKPFVSGDLTLYPEEFLTYALAERSR